jgi:hypothetical protein
VIVGAIIAAGILGAIQLVWRRGGWRIRSSVTAEFKKMEGPVTDTYLRVEGLPSTTSEVTALISEGRGHTDRRFGPHPYYPGQGGRQSIRIDSGNNPPLDFTREHLRVQVLVRQNGGAQHLLYDKQIPLP